MNRTLAAVALAAVAFEATSNAAHAACTAQSPAHTVALVELYTSEGCSDCPPADQWLGKLKAAGLSSVVPLALHVDYWDYIGWKDPFAKALFSARQRDLSSIQGKSFVYTPQVLLGGRDFRKWSAARDFDGEVKRINAMPAKASIALALSESRNGVMEAKASAQPLDKSAADAVLYLALTESGLSNRVSAGENRGVTLSHDWVAREWTGPVALAGAKGAQATANSRLAAGRGAAVAFVQDRRSGEILQALALPACAP
jgi:hypothetical protein